MLRYNVPRLVVWSMILTSVLNLVIIMMTSIHHGQVKQQFRDIKNILKIRIQ
ncbi:hypothetical protein [Bacillus sp. FJAT-44742]|uniref:hypothetical protein n=1 Tax=Bacillus sp. FJAT-44742 TaxID=2014005 RepID=UPI0012FEA07D|nr:hypothetical protein [Bacillus sp. FJAT-44742]